MDSLVLNGQEINNDGHLDLSMDQDHDFVNQREDEKDEGNTLPLCFEAFDIIRRGFQVIIRGHISAFPWLSFFEIGRNSEDHDPSFEDSCIEESDFELTIEEEEHAKPSFLIDDEMEESISLNTYDCEITCQIFVPFENAS